MDLIEDGVYKFGPLPYGGSAIIQLIGNFESGSAALGFVDADDTFYPYNDDAGDPIVLTAGGIVSVLIPKDAEIAVSLTSSITPLISFSAWPHARS